MHSGTPTTPATTQPETLPAPRAPELAAAHALALSGLRMPAAALAFALFPTERAPLADAFGGRGAL